MHEHHADLAGSDQSAKVVPRGPGVVGTADRPVYEFAHEVPALGVGEGARPVLLGVEAGALELLRT